MMGGRSGGQLLASKINRLRQGAAWIASCLGLVGLQVGASTGPVLAQDTTYRASDAAPAAWREYARRLRAALQDRLSADENAARAIRQFVEARAPDSKPERTFEARVWITPNGDLERLDFVGVDPAFATVLRGVLVRERFIPAPPPGMLQPIHLRFSFDDQK